MHGYFIEKNELNGTLFKKKMNCEGRFMRYLQDNLFLRLKDELVIVIPENSLCAPSNVSFLSLMNEDHRVQFHLPVLLTTSTVHVSSFFNVTRAHFKRASLCS